MKTQLRKLTAPLAAAVLCVGASVAFADPVVTDTQTTVTRPVPPPISESSTQVTTTTPITPTPPPPVVSGGVVEKNTTTTTTTAPAPSKHEEKKELKREYKEKREDIEHPDRAVIKKED